MRCLAGVLLVSVAVCPGVTAAQDTAAAVVPAPQTVDSAAMRRPVSPMGAFWRSFLLPGWGQAKLNRKLTGGIFIAFEGLTLGMALKTNHQLGYLKRTGDAAVDAKKQELEDWLTLLVFNHLMSGLEAYVSAHLWDFPGDLSFQAVPGGGGITVSVPLPRQ